MLLDHLDSDMDDLTRTFWEVHFQPEADDLAVLFDGVDLAKDAKKRGWQMSVNADLLEGVDLTLPSSRGEVTKKLQEGQPRILVACPPSRTSGDDGARLLDPVRQRVRFIKEQTAATLVQFAVQEAVAQVDRGGEIVFEQPSSQHNLGSSCDETFARAPRGSSSWWVSSFRPVNVQVREPDLGIHCRDG